MATSATHLLQRFSYPKTPGDQPWSIIDVQGPQSYEQINPGTGAGGQIVTAADFGLQALDFVVSMGGATWLIGGGFGTYAIVIPPSIPSLGGIQAAIGGSFDHVRLMWFLTPTAQEASAGMQLINHAVRLLAIGR